MHKSGKILIWVIVVLILFGALPLSVKMVGVQTSWQNRVRVVRESNEKLAVELADKQVQVERLEEELAQAQLGWDRVWNGVPMAVLDPQEGRIGANLGRRVGMNVRVVTTDTGDQQVPPLVYVFRPTPEGGYLYVGEFQVLPETLDDAKVHLRATWNLTPEDVAEFESWRTLQNPRWRFRTQIPLANKLRFDELYKRRLTAEQEFQSKNRNLARQQESKRTADEELVVRRGELLGNPDAATVRGRPEFSVGLVRAIADEEELRNALQVDVDQLRRGIKHGSDTREQLANENRDLAGRLPQASRLADGR